MRTTLPEMDMDVALKNLTLPENVFDLSELEMNQVYGLFADCHMRLYGVCGCLQLK